MVFILINIVQWVVQLITVVVIVKIFLSYFMSPWQPVRLFFDRLVDPMLAPIRRIVPPLGMFDFSPLVLIILLQLLGTILVNLILAIFR